MTPLVLMDALQQTGTPVFEPIQHVRLEAPADTFGILSPVLARVRAIPRTQATRGVAYVPEGEIPAARVYELQRLLPALTRGEGVVESAFASCQPARGQNPTRARSDHNPLNRKEYLIQVRR